MPREHGRSLAFFITSNQNAQGLGVMTVVLHGTREVASTCSAVGVVVLCWPGLLIALRLGGALVSGDNLEF